jgi:hypothetical protein
MITTNQQEAIDQITELFENFNIQSTQKPISKLAMEIKNQIEQSRLEVENFKIQTESYDIANSQLFDSVTEKMIDLIDDLGLDIKISYGKMYDGYVFHQGRSYTIIFPMFNDNTTAFYDNKFHFDINVIPITTYHERIQGLHKSGFDYKINNSTYSNEDELFEALAKHIVAIFKRYQK